MLVISTPLVGWPTLVGYWVVAAGTVALGSLALESIPILLIMASLLALGMLITSAFEALRGSYTVTIDCDMDLVSVVASARWRRATEGQFALSSFGAAATRWDKEYYYYYRLELIEKGGRGSLLLKRFPVINKARWLEDTSAACRSHVAAITGLADAGLLRNRGHDFRDLGATRARDRFGYRVGHACGQFLRSLFTGRKQR